MEKMSNKMSIVQLEQKMVETFGFELDVFSHQSEVLVDKVTDILNLHSYFFRSLFKGFLLGFLGFSRLSCFILTPAPAEKSAGIFGEQFPPSFVQIQLHGAELRQNKLREEFHCPGTVCCLTAGLMYPELILNSSQREVLFLFWFLLRTLGS